MGVLFLLFNPSLRAEDSTPIVFDVEECVLVLTSAHSTTQVQSGPGEMGIRLSQKNQKQALELRAKGIETTLTVQGGEVNGAGISDSIFIDGIPEWVKPLQYQPGQVFRHYTADIKGILSSSQLIAGNRGYIVPNEYQRVFYRSLTGIFFTTPEHPPEELRMGLSKDSDYVDFMFEPGTAALELLDNNFVVPLQPMLYPWVKELYLQYREVGRLDPKYSSLKSDFERMDLQGGIQSAQQIPIRIVGYQKKGKRVTVGNQISVKPRSRGNRPGSQVRRQRLSSSPYALNPGIW